MILDEANREGILEKCRKTASKLKTITREEIEAENRYWESVLTTAANCNSRTITVRCFEDNDRVYEKGF